MLQYYKTQIVVNEDKARLIQLNTMHHDQDDNASIVWLTERRKRLTSSNIKDIYKRRQTTAVAPLVQRLLYTTFRGNVATRWGLDHEDSSVLVYLLWLQQERKSLNATVNNKCGLVVSTSYPWLAATPDGWVNDPTAAPPHGLVEFKNPYGYRNLCLADAIATKQCDCLTIDNGCKQLKRTHAYYYQVQMAMFCTQREWCDFLVCTTVDHHCERIDFDKSFCVSLLPKLRRFFFLAILPELTLKKNPIREPDDWISDANNWLEEIARTT